MSNSVIDTIISVYLISILFFIFLNFIFFFVDLLTLYLNDRDNNPLIQYSWEDNIHIPRAFNESIRNYMSKPAMIVLTISAILIPLIGPIFYFAWTFPEGVRPWYQDKLIKWFY